MFKTQFNILVSPLFVFGVCVVSFASEDNENPTGYKESLIHGALEASAVLPDKKLVASFRRKLPSSLSVLRSTLRHKDKGVRFHTAYIIDELGPKASPLIPDLLQAMQVESEYLPKVYIVVALSSVSGKNRKVATQLRTAFSSESDPTIKTNLAGALVIVSSPKDEKNAWKWLLDSLKRPIRKPKSFVDEPWDRPWAAADMLGRLGADSEPAIKKMESLEKESTTPNWVKTKLIDSQAIILNKLKKTPTNDRDQCLGLPRHHSLRCRRADGSIGGSTRQPTQFHIRCRRA